MEIFYVKYIQPDFHKFLQKTIWEKCSFTFVWTRPIYCHTRGACGLSVCGTARLRPVCGGLVSRARTPRFRHPILAPGNTESNCIVSSVDLESRSHPENYVQLSNWVIVGSWYAVELPARHERRRCASGGELVTLTNLRFKLAST